MARHRFSRGLTLSRARHRKPTRIQRVAEHGLHSIVLAAAAAVIVFAIVGTNPSPASRA